MITKHNVETAYSFFHQKYRVYKFSNIDWQKDDIEYAISSYIEDMDKELYLWLSDGKNDYLLDHNTFASDISAAIDKMEQMLGI